jgi:glycerophosphoryl diester phosphodiesterase
VNTRKVLRIGHRGTGGYEPENTLAAIRKGIALGLDYVEVDVQQTSDGALVLMHDKTVDRTTNGTGFVSDLTWNEIRKVDAGNQERVPSLSEALSLANGKIGVILESITPGIGMEIQYEVGRSSFDGPVIFSSFHHADILAIRRTASSAMTMALLEGIPVTLAAFAIEARAAYVGLSIDSVTREFIRALHDAHLKVLVYTINEPLLIETAKQLEVDGIISDFPDRI